MLKFTLNKSLKLIIDNALNDLYKKLNIDDLDILKKYTKKIIEIIGYQYNLNPDDYYAQLEVNDYKDIKWISSLLLPYSYQTLSELPSFSSMYTEKYDENIDINKEEPKYKYSTIQYSRYDNITKLNNTISNERSFNIEYLKNNYLLLIKSILQSSHKLYVNWINIRPYTVSDIYTSHLYIYTDNLIKNKKIIDIDTELENISFNDYIPDFYKKLLGTLHVRDMYNVLRNYYYEEIKIIKLLIFDLYSPGTNKLIPALHVLRDIFMINNNDFFKMALENKMWYEFDITLQNLFSDKWNELCDFYLNKKNMDIKTIYKNRENQNQNIDIIDINDINQVISYSVSNISIKNLMKAILISFDFKYANSKKVRNSKYIQIETGRKKINLDENPEIIDEENINIINIYNDKESLKSIKSELIYDYFRDILQQFKNTVYVNLLIENKKDINDTKFTDLLDLSEKNKYNFAKALSHKTENNKYILLDKHWDSLSNEDKTLIINRLNNKTSDWFNISRILKTQQELGFIDKGKNEIKKVNKGIYNSIFNTLSQTLLTALFLKGTLSKYIPNPISIKSLENITIKDIINNTIFNDDTYFKDSYYYLTEKLYIDSGNYVEKIKNDDWYSMDPMQWVSQLGFVHHFINQRVSFLSGATGVGKSTHVPKLFLYNLKALDYKTNSSVVCTQPRRTPTEGGARTVSKQLGLPIFNEKNEIDEFNENDKNINSKFTDFYNVQMQHKQSKHTRNIYGQVLKFITDGSLLSEFRDILPYFKVMTYDKKQITNRNLYDVIIIDESHEHNKNMDILLTLMRTFCYYNPSIRLVILSATLDDDEPTYRRYYRCINDNLKYPFDNFIKNKNLDRINIDRRYDISPPGSGTRFLVSEHYKPEFDTKEGIITLIKSLIKEAKGDILVFQPGEADIKKLIEELNKSIDDNWIALPFYSSLNEERRNFIENIDDTFSSLRIDRNSDFNDVTSLTEGNKSYSNFVLIATNIAEASITIKRLYYVIDTGTRKINRYDFKRRNEKLKLDNISETSRIQRKGRVGRRGPGEAYFTYKKGKMSKNKIPYDFSISNLDMDLYNLLQNNSEEKSFNYKDKKYYEIIKSIYETINGEYNYIGNKDHFNYDFTEYKPIYYETGYNIEDLKDNSGRFYLIHPDELIIERNINGKIIKINEDNEDDIKIIDKEKGIIESNKINSFFEDLYISNFIDSNNNKTEEGINISEIIEKLQLENKKNTKALVYSMLTDCFDKMALGIAIFESIKNDIIKFVKKDIDNPIINKIKYYSKYKNIDSDIEILIQSTYDFLNAIDYKTMFNLESHINNDFTIDNKKINYIDILDKFKSYESYEDDIDRNDIIMEILYRLNKNILNNKQIKKLLDDMELNSDIIINKKSYNNIINNYIKIVDLKNQLFYPDKNDKSYKDFINKYKDIYRNKYSNYDNFKLSFLLSNPYNISLNITGTNSFIIVNYPVTDNIFDLSKTKTIINNKKEYVLTTYMNPNDLRGYLLYNNLDSDRDTISNFIKIDKTYLKIFPMIYDKFNLKYIVEKHNFKIKKYLDKLEKEKEFGVPLSKTYDVISKYGDTYIKLMNDLSS